MNNHLNFNSIKCNSIYLINFILIIFLINIFFINIAKITFADDNINSIENIQKLLQEQKKSIQNNSNTVNKTLEDTQNLPINFSLEYYQLPFDFNQGQSKINISKLEAESEGDISNKKRLLLLLWLEPEDNYYTYSHNISDQGLPTQIVLNNIPTDYHIEIYYPTGEPYNSEDKNSFFIYKQKTPIFIEVTQNNPEEFLSLDFNLNLGLCSENNCIPVYKNFNLSFKYNNFNLLPYADQNLWWSEFLTLYVNTSKINKIQTNTELTLNNDELVNWNFSPQYLNIELEVSKLSTAILFGILAGFILNFMPCVLPVVSLKFGTFLLGSHIQDEQKRKKEFRIHNLAFAAGILTWFSLLALILSGLELIWGQLFQSQLVIFIMIILIFILGLSIFGFYTLPMLSLRQPYLKPKTQLQVIKTAFSTGLLATMLATPCSGPFLGGVLGWTLKQPVNIITLVFISVGLGMSLPYLIFAIFPNLVKIFPKPGPWLGKLETVMAIFLFATIFYLLTLLSSNLLILTLLCLFSLTIIIIIWQKKRKYTYPINWLSFFSITALFILTLIIWTGFNATNIPTTAWQNFNPKNFKEELEQNNIVLEFTADWCPNCKLLEHTIFTEKNIKKWKSEYNITFIQVDMTNHLAENTHLLIGLNSNSIPLVALFSPTEPEKPLILRDLFNTITFEQALKQKFK